MADGDSDIPPLEDMTEVLKQANAIRDQLDGKNVGKESKAQKTKAKVNKKPPTARAVHSPTKKDEPSESPKGRDDVRDSNESHSVIKEENRTPVTNASKTTKDVSGLFGGMKKGFLFGAPNKSSTKSTTTSTKDSSGKVNEKDQKKVSKAEDTMVGKSKGEEIPFISPKGKTEPGLAFNEVQQAMSEAKGLLDNQDWITDDFLNKIEKNDFLVKRFADPKFMTALTEFQTNPEAAMTKYKGNQEVEKFLTEFCGLLGNHFTNIGSSEEDKTKTQPKKDTKSPSKFVPLVEEKQVKHSGPKIVELDDDDQNAAASLKNSCAPGGKGSSENSSNSPLHTLTNVNKQNVNVSRPNNDIKTHRHENRAEINEANVATDEDVKQALNDPKVMEILTDPQIIQLIQTLKEDPAKGQRIVDKADSSLRIKIQFLVSKGLLQFQTG